MGPRVAIAIEGLDAQGPYPEHAAELMLFGQMVGDWDVVIENQRDDGSWQKVDGEWHFGWVLQGRAIQDVWIAYRPDAKRGDANGVLSLGTTVRVYEAKEQVWHVNWMGVLNHNYTLFAARPVESEIVMNATDDDGSPMQWIFYDISEARFSWRAQNSTDEGKTWTVRQRMTATRRTAP